MSDEPRFDDAALKRYVEQFLAPKVPTHHLYVEVAYQSNGVLKVEVVAKINGHWQVSGDLAWAISQHDLTASVKVTGSW